MMSVWVVLSFIVSGIALGWNIYRDCIDRPRMRVKADVVMSLLIKSVTSADVIAKMFEISSLVNINPEAINAVVDKINEPTEVIYVEVTNIGKKSIIINRHEFQLEKDENLVIGPMREKFHNKKLEPYECLQVEFPNEVLLELSKVAARIKSFCIYDTHGKMWALSKANLRKLKENLTKNIK